MKKILVIASLLLCGCLATENRRIPMSSRSDGVASVTTQPWWRTPYYPEDKYKAPWDLYVPAPTPDPLALELKYFENNVVKWPETMPPPYVPERSPKQEPKQEAEPAGEVY